MPSVSLVDGHIDEPKLTDEQIITGLERAVKLAEYVCSDYCDIRVSTIKDTIDFINRQKAEIDILIRKHDNLRDEIAEYQAEIERLKGWQDLLKAE